MQDLSELWQKYVYSARRLVVKVGTNLLASPDKPLDDQRLGALVAELAALVKDGRQVALVTSGAIGCGMAELGMRERPTTLPLIQAVASVGQGKLMAHYERHFAAHGLHAAQILLTHEDFDNRERYLNACNTIFALFELPCVPVINENDTISTQEIRFGDNDHLAALVTHLIRADLLVLLTSVPGLYVGRPRAGEPAQVLPVVEKVDAAIEALAYDETTPWGLGGMKSKIRAARVATEAGEAALIADGRRPEVLRCIMSGQPTGTLFLPAGGKMRSYKRWLRFTSRPRGELRVDAGAKEALLHKGKSLLPSGIKAVSGRFQRGDVVRVLGPDGEELARGLSNYSSDEVERIRGIHTSRIAEVLGYKYYDEVIHRDNMALVE